MSASQDPDVVVPGPARNLRGTAVAATALAALLLMGIGLSPASATVTAPPAGPGASAPAPGGLDPDVAQRLVGIAQDLAEAVTHGEITEQQAEDFLLKMHHRLAA